MRSLLCYVLIFIIFNLSQAKMRTWQKSILEFPYTDALQLKKTIPAFMTVVRQDHENLVQNKSVVHAPLKIGNKKFDRGLGVHSTSIIRICSSIIIQQFHSFVGINTEGNNGGTARFSVHDENGVSLYQSNIKAFGEEPDEINVATSGVNEIFLVADDAGDGPSYDHAIWANAYIVLKNGEKLWLDELNLNGTSQSNRVYPFSFVYDNQDCDLFLAKCDRSQKTEQLDEFRTKVTTIWSDLHSGLRIAYEVICYQDYSSMDFVLYFENTGNKNTGIIENVYTLDTYLSSSVTRPEIYRLYHTKGSLSTFSDFEVSVKNLVAGDIVRMGGTLGRPSFNDFPFFKIEDKTNSYIFGVGWTGQWQSIISVQSDSFIRVRCGMEKTHFRLYPGEKVRMPRILMVKGEGDTWNSNIECRQLIYKYYTARKNGVPILPTLFCNTCFTRNGVWLNETTADNQISLIKAYSKFGIEALMTDAGWFEGGWPDGAGNWTPRKDNYPEGIAPVAKVAMDNGIIYGLWFEPERVMTGSQLHQNHPEWLLKTKQSQSTFLLNFGLPEARHYFFNIVSDFMKMPGFRAYRQDFNVDPLPFWIDNDAPDRQGITEIRYVTGLYEYWDMLADAWPDSFREGCSSGGRRIDIESLSRFHCHQKTDFWFNPEVDQNSLWAISQYLPNSAIVAHLNSLDEYAFHSVLPSSLCLGWIADDPTFDNAKASLIVEQYKSIRELLVGAWYPLTKSSRDTSLWIGSQYHRGDLQRGFILVLRRPQSQCRSIEVSLQGLEPNSYYKLKGNYHQAERISGMALMSRFVITLEQPRQSDLIVYEKVSE